jgi:hypothetical protein
VDVDRQKREGVIPEDILLIQFWMEIVRVKIPTADYTDIAWGRQFRNGFEIGHGPIVSIQDGGLLHIDVTI